MVSSKRVGVAFLMPALIFFLVLILYPLVLTVWLSLRDYNWFTGRDVFVWLKNYSRIFADPAFWSALNKSLLWTLGSLIGQLIIGGGAALLINSQIKGGAGFQSFFLIPWVIPTVVTALAWRWLFHEFWGSISYLLCALGLTDERVNLLSLTSTALPAVILVNIWRGYPLMMVNLLAALKGIPEELYEAARVDGASRFRCFIHITLPMLTRVGTILMIVRTIWIFNYFDLIWLLTRGGPASSTQTLPILVYLKSFGSYRFGDASATALIMFLILSAISMVYFRLIDSEERK
jgi:multiple sugar transport system permease protein